MGSPQDPRARARQKKRRRQKEQRLNDKALAQQSGQAEGAKAGTATGAALSLAPDHPAPGGVSAGRGIEARGTGPAPKGSSVEPASRLRKMVSVVSYASPERAAFGAETPG